MIYEFTAEVWRASAEAAWRFATLPADLTPALKQMRGRSRSWGSMRVVARTGGSTWRTSLFPDSRAGAFLLPVKAEIRRAENIRSGEARTFRVELEF